VFKEIVEQLAAGDLVSRSINHLAPRLLAENLIPQPFGILSVG